MYDYATHEVKILNSTNKDYSDLKANVQVYNIDSNKVYDKEFTNLAVTPDGASAAVGGQPKQIGYQTINFDGKIEEATELRSIDKIER